MDCINEARYETMQRDPAICSILLSFVRKAGEQSKLDCRTQEFS